MEFWLTDQTTNQRQTINVQAKDEAIIIGRDETCQIQLKGPFVARRHAKLYLKGNQFFIENLSRSGLRVANRDVVDQPARVEFGDEIQIAQFSLAMIRP